MPALKIQINVSGFKGLDKEIRQIEDVVIALGGEELRAAVVQNVSIPAMGGSRASHERALGALGHPYAARRFSTIQIRPSGGYPGFAKPELKVHTVSGNLRSAIRGVFEPRGTKSKNGPSYSVFGDERKAPHIRSVIKGTRVMLPRDIIWETAIDPGFQRALRRVIVRVFGELFRTKVGLRFKPIPKVT